MTSTATIDDLFAKLSDPQRGFARLVCLYYSLQRSVAKARIERDMSAPMMDEHGRPIEAVTFDTETLDTFLSEFWGLIICLGHEADLDDDFVRVLAMIDAAGEAPLAPHLRN